MSWAIVLLAAALAVARHGYKAWDSSAPTEAGAAPNKSLTDVTCARSAFRSNLLRTLAMASVPVCRFLDTNAGVARLRLGPISPGWASFQAVSRALYYRRNWADELETGWMEPHLGGPARTKWTKSTTLPR
jgi:hypothetical protein